MGDCDSGGIASVAIQPHDSASIGFAAVGSTRMCREATNMRNHRLIRTIWAVAAIAEASCVTAHAQQAATSQPVAATSAPVKIVAGPMFTADSPNTISMWIQTEKPGRLHAVAQPLIDKGGAPFAGGKQEVDIETLSADRNIGLVRFMYHPGRRYSVIISPDTGGAKPPPQGGMSSLLEAKKRAQQRNKKQGGDET